MSTITSRTVEARDGTELAVTDCGEGEPSLLFINGWAADRRIYDRIVERLSAHRRAVSLDWRSHGDSGRVTEDFGLDELVDDALDVIAALGLERPVLVANSHAGWITLELARRLPGRVPAVAVVSWMVLGPPPPFVELIAAMRDPETARSAADQLLARWSDGHDIPALSELLDRMRAHDDAMWVRAAREISASFAREGRPLEAFSALDPPIPLLHLYADPPDDGYLAAQQAFADEHPWFSVVRVSGARSHFPMLEAPEEVAEAIETHVRAAEREADRRGRGTLPRTSAVRGAM